MKLEITAECAAELKAKLEDMLSFFVTEKNDEHHTSQEHCDQPSVTHTKVNSTTEVEQIASVAAKAMAMATKAAEETETTEEMEAPARKKPGRPGKTTTSPATEATTKGVLIDQNAQALKEVKAARMAEVEKTENKPEVVTPLKSVDKAAVIQALQKLNEEKGLVAAKEVLAKFNAQRFGELKEADYPAFVEACFAK